MDTGEAVMSVVWFAYNMYLLHDCLGGNGYRYGLSGAFMAMFLVFWGMHFLYYVSRGLDNE